MNAEQTAAERILAAAFPADGPGGVAIVSEGGEPIYRGARGLADIRSGKKLSPDHVFRLGSITKQFTAAAILKLVDEGLLSLAEPISRFFPDWPGPAARASVRQLLNHTSGLQDFTKVPGWIAAHRQEDFDMPRLLDVMRDLPAKAAPGDEFEYNNGGYIMLGAMIEKVTSAPWHEVVAEKLTRSLGLSTIAFGEDKARGAPAAIGHTVRGNVAVRAEPSNLSLPSTGGGLVGTLNDLARWSHALHGDRVLSPALYAEMIAPARLNDGSTEAYGMGLGLRSVRSEPVIGHGGSIAGFRTDCLYIPSRDIFVAVFANSDEPATDPDVPLRELAALALGNPFPVMHRAEVSPEEVSSLFGTYSADNGPPRRFYSEEGKFFHARGEQRYELIPAGSDIFVTRKGLTWLQFTRHAEDSITLDLHDIADIEPKRAVRLGDLPAPFIVPMEQLKAYVGKFDTEGPSFELALGNTGKLVMSSQDTSAELRPVSEHKFMADQHACELVFQVKHGTADRFTMRRGARELHGTRTRTR